MKKWRCTKCRATVESDKRPSERYEPTRTAPVPDKHNEFVGVPNPDTQSSARHYGPVCFGPDRGEDYYQHEWQEIK